MPTFGRHLRPDRMLGNYWARCQICSVVWLRSDMVEDGAGKIVCPDHSPARHGLDEVTLEQMNAEALAEQTEIPNMDGTAVSLPATGFQTSPPSIAGLAAVGWWPADQRLTTRGSTVRWDNSAPFYGEGNLVSSGTAPTVSGDSVVFAGGGPMASPSGSLLRAGDEPTLWMVAALTEETETYQEMLAVTTGGDSSTALAGVAIGRYRTDTNSGQVYAWVKFAQDDAGFTLLAPRPSSPSGQHMYTVTATSSLVTLTIDDDSYTGAPTYGAGFQVPCGSVTMGYQAYGTYYEAVVHR